MHRTLVAFCLARNEIQQGARRSRNPAFFRDFSWESGTLSRAFLSSCMPYFLFSSTLRPVPSLLCVAKEVSAAERELGMAEKKKKKKTERKRFRPWPASYPPLTRAHVRAPRRGVLPSCSFATGSRRWVGKSRRNARAFFRKEQP